MNGEVRELATVEHEVTLRRRPAKQPALKLQQRVVSLVCSKLNAAHDDKQTNEYNDNVESA